MKRKTRIILIIIVVAAIVTPAAVYTVLLGTIDVPGVDVQKIEFNSFDRETGTIRFDVQLDMMNDNFFDAKLNFLNLEVYFDGAFAGIIFHEVNRWIGARRNESFGVMFILCNAPALQTDIITVTVEGVANVDVYHINDCVPVKETERINVRKEFNQAPNAVIRDNAGFFTHTHREIRFDASRSSDPDGSIEGYQWDFGDGSPTQSGVVVGHTYDSAGDYTVELTVWDNWNRSGKAMTSIRIVGMA